MLLGFRVYSLVCVCVCFHLWGFWGILSVLRSGCCLVVSFLDLNGC